MAKKTKKKKASEKKEDNKSTAKKKTSKKKKKTTSSGKKKSVKKAKSKKKTTKKKAKKKKASKKKPTKKKKKETAKKKKKSTKETTKTPQTMEELLEQTGYQITGLEAGQKVKGAVTDKTRRSLFIDIGAKTEGIVFDREYKQARTLIDELEIGDEVEATVVQPENESGQIVLSLKYAALDQAWGFFEEKMETDEAFEVDGKDVNKGGLIVDAQDIQGFVPSSQFGRELSDKINSLIGKKIKVKAIEVDRAKNRLILSERAVSEAEMLAAQEEALDKVKIGGEYEAEITAVMPFGFFVKIYFGKGDSKTFLEGLVHISEISWDRVKNVQNYGKEGEKIKVKVLAIEEKSGKLSLSMKRLKNDPWEDVEKKYQKDKKVNGTVERIAPFGFFVKLEPGVEGLVHISKIPAGFSPQVGDEINCFVDKLDLENRRMSLGVVLKEKPVGYK